MIPLVRDGLFERNRGLAFWIARRFRYWADEDDLGQEAQVGLQETLGEIGRRWGVSGERARQVELWLARRLRDRLGEGVA